MDANNHFHSEMLRYANCPPVLGACIRRLGCDPEHLDWLSLYIPPLVKTNTRIPGPTGLKPNRELLAMPIGACLAVARNLILCGEPGCGRAAFARALACLSIGKYTDQAGRHPEMDVLKEQGITPVFYPMDEKTAATASALSEVNLEGKILLILDGRSHPNERILERIHALSAAMQKQKEVRFLVLADGEASRWMHAIHDPAWAVAGVEPLDDGHGGWFIDRWLDAFSGNMDAGSTQAIHRFRTGWLKDHGWIRHPLELTLVLFYLSRKGASLPILKEQFFSEVLHALIDSDSMNEEDEEAFLQELGALAFHSLTDANEKSDKGSQADKVERKVIQTYPDQSGGIMEIRDGMPPAFIHNTFRQHLAAAYLAGLPMMQVAPSLRKMLNSDREVVRIALVLIYLGQPEKYLLVLDTLLDEGADAKESGLTLAACQSLAYLWERQDPKDSGLSVDAAICRKALLAAIDSMKCQYPHRVEAGNALSVIGDERFNPDMWQLPNDGMLGFVEIPEGDFIMGTDEAEVPSLIETLGVGSDWDGQTLGEMLSIEPNLDVLIREMGLSEGWESLEPIHILPQWYKREIPQHRLWLPAYYIARFPVTLAQFQRFVIASGYPFTFPTRFQERMNHPVTGVQWADAMAYCRWLHQELATSERTPAWLQLLLQSPGTWRITLPSEAEWEKAARGPADGEVPNRSFPWGDAFDAGKANLKEAGIGATSSVGCFPEGASPFGVQDLAGNVWEWTRSMWGEEEYRVHYPYPYDPHDGRESRQPDRVNALRVLRGASYNNYQRYARCATRRSPFPELKSSARGFRVAISRSEI